MCDIIIFAIAHTHITRLDILTYIIFSDGVKQFVMVTAIDKIGVPIADIKNAYRYGCIRKYCKKVSEAFDVDLLHVLPVSNYFSEGCADDAKNAMSLLSLWRVFDSAKDYIERRLTRDDDT